MSADTFQELRALLARLEYKERTPRKRKPRVIRKKSNRHGCLTDLLKYDKQAKDAFRSNMLLSRSRRRGRIQIQVPRSSSPLIMPGDLGDIGRAYDYWMRVVCIVTNQLGKELFREFLGYRIYKEKYARRSRFRKAVERCMTVLDRCYESAAFFDRQLLWSLIVLGYFEREYRAGIPVLAEYLDNDDELRQEIMNEFSKLACASDISWLRGNVILNLVFSLVGNKASLIGDGDILVDGTLYELKTSCDLRPLETLRQLLGYVVMNSLAPRYEIDAIGFYYVRYGAKVWYQLSDVATQEQIAVLGSVMKSRVGQNVCADLSDRTATRKRQIQRPRSTRRSSCLGARAR